jgi:hypothetical protein
MQPQLDSPISWTISRTDWQLAVRAHEVRVEPWVKDRRVRSSKGVPHAVFDFLFNYYSFRPAQLSRWSPGVGVLIEGATHESFPGAADFRQTSEGIILEAIDFAHHRREYLRWAIRYLETTGARSPTLSCFGLHEWAMLYRAEQVRHRTIPLRLPLEEIAKVVESSDLRCSHYDAFRFFTPLATPRNRTQLSRSQTEHFDQPGCIHVTMDLYRFAYKIFPFCRSDIVADAFELAAEAREIDMRASPYDVSSYGFQPICIETTEGREEYIGYQRALALKAKPIRQALLTQYRLLT